MRDSVITEDILSSWRRCMNISLESSISCPIVHLDEDAIEEKSSRNNTIISLFKESTEKVYNLVTKERYFLLTDSEGIVLSFLSKKPIKACFAVGMSLAEESSGTNAIALALKYVKTAYTLPKHHYCAFLNKMSILAAPLFCDENIVGAIAMVLEEQPISKELMAIIELLSYKISIELLHIQSDDIVVQKSNTVKCKAPNSESGIKLNEKQLTVMNLLAGGLTDKAAAVSMGVSIDTVRYHKRIIFKKLNAASMLEAIIISLKLGLISIDNI